MNKTASETKEFASALKAALPKTKLCEAVVCVPYICIPAAVKAFKNTWVSVGAQNMHEEERGAYTGEISATMLKSEGVKYVIIGHSERRRIFGETDESVNKKVIAALNAGLYPIVCVGEKLEQRELGILSEVIGIQVKTALSGVPADKIRRVVIAYEPVWAIGTGINATAEQANEAGREIRAFIRSMYDAKTARAITVQYGGSMNSENANEFFAQPDVDGGLIGGASLSPEEFVKIIEAANR